MRTTESNFDHGPRRNYGTSWSNVGAGAPALVGGPRLSFGWGGAARGGGGGRPGSPCCIIPLQQRALYRE